MATKKEYQTLRHAAIERMRRLEKAGFKTPSRPISSRGLTQKQIDKEFNKLKKWMNKETSTVKGAKEHRQRTNERRREAQRAKREQERKEKERWEETRRIEAEKIKQAHEQALQLQADIAQESPQARIALQNLLSGLHKYGVEIKDIKELKAWAKYIKERKSDSKDEKYRFDQYIDELLNATDNNVMDESGHFHASTEDIEGLMQDFSKWSIEQENLEAEYTRPRQPNEYTGDDLSGLWNAYIKNRN